VPFDAIARDWIDRPTFVVNGEKHASTVAEAISLSQMIHESLLSNPLGTAFSFPRASVKSADFGHFLDFARSRDSPC
jgi:hypothetical protein